MSLIVETTKPAAPARRQKSALKKVAPRTKKAIKAIKAEDSATQPTKKKAKGPKPQMQAVYKAGKVKAVISDLFACYISQWTGYYDRRASQKANWAKAAEVMPLCAERIGTHTAKFQNSRIHVSQIPPLVAEDAQGKNLPLSYMGGVDGYQRVGYVLLHPIRFDDEAEARCIFERIRDRGDLSDPLVAALLKPATPLARVMLRRAVMREDDPECQEIVPDNFPMIYVPDADFQDTLVTPLQAKDFYTTINDIRWMTAPEGEAEFRRPLRHRDVAEHALVTKASNIGCKSPTRARVRTFLPKVSSEMHAATYRYVRGGKFPWLRDDRLAEMMQKAVELFETTQGPDAYNNTHIRHGILSLVAAMKSVAQDHIDQILSLAAEEFDWAPEYPPSAENLLMAYRPRLRSDEARQSLRNFLASDTFHSALKKA